MVRWRGSRDEESHDPVAEMERLAEELHDRAAELRRKIAEFRRERGMPPAPQEPERL